MKRSVFAAGVAILVVLGAIALSVQPASGGISSSPPAPPESITVSGSVQSFPPDGGFVVQRIEERVGISGVVDTNIAGQAAPLDTSITSSTPLQVTGLLGGRVEADVTGIIEVSGYSSVPTVALENGTIVNLGTTSLNTLTATTGKGNCTYVDGDPTATIGTTAANLPASPMANRTAIEIFNHSVSPANYLLCSAQGTATLTSGVRIESGHQSRKWEGLGAGVLISCRCATGTCTYNTQEEFCYQQ